MGFLNDMFGFDRSSKESESIKRRKSLRNRICRIEEMESREMLSATPYEPPGNINIGAVYHEDCIVASEREEGVKEDSGGDTFTVSWNGGAAGTSLKYLLIDLRSANAKESMYFNVDPTKPQPDNGEHFPFTIGEGSDIQLEDLEWRLSENGQCLEIFFKDGVFEGDKTFQFKIDVNMKDSDGIYPLVPGKHFENVTMKAVFDSEKFEDLTYETKFIDTYRDPGELNLNVPPDEYFTEGGGTSAIMTAGVVDKIEDIQKPRPGSISGYVYEDVNNDGVFDRANGEKGIAGVQLELFVLNEHGEYVSTYRYAETDADGKYVFKDVEGGRTYKVVEAQPKNYADGKDTPGFIGVDQVGKAWEPDQLGEIHIGANEHGVEYNFGELKRAELGGYVYHDRNNNGLRESGEEGIANVTVKLQVLVDGVYRDVEGQVTRTGADGKYLFENLDPFQTYRVVEVNQPEGFADGRESVGTVGGIKVGNLPSVDNDTIEGIFLGYAESGNEYNFGEYKKGSISGYVYEDDDNDGVKDPGEKGIDGVTVWLCYINEKGEKEYIRSTTTKDGGRYDFGDLEPGKTYCVTEVDPEGYCDGINSVGTVGGEHRGSENVDIPAGHDQLHDIYIGSGEDGVNYNFAENRQGHLSGYVYEDVNKNGYRDAGDKAIAGVTLTLWVWSDKDGKYVQTSKTATTDHNGYYEFTELCPFNKYMICESQPVNFDDAAETVGSIDGKTVGQLPKVDNDSIFDILLPPGGKGENYNFGEVKIDTPPPPDDGSISGYVYVDKDKNGVKDAGEIGIPGVTLSLWVLKNGSYVDTGRTATTDAYGKYVFGDLPTGETYMVRETQPAAFDDGRESIGTVGGQKVGSLPTVDNDTIFGIMLPSGGQGENYNFGEWEKDAPDPDKGSISGYVYVDSNKSGVKDAGERGIAGVTLELYRLVDGQYVSTGRTALTDSSGFYIFADLNPNETYMVRETQPAGYNDGRESVGSIGGSLVGRLPSVDNDTILGITLPPGGKGVNYNFGEWEKDAPAPEKGSLSGYVYYDTNKNGVRDSNESGIGGVTLQLYRLVNGQYVSTGRSAKTDSRGFYIFTDLDPNETYMISERQPVGFEDGRETVGTIGGVTVGNLPTTDNDTIRAIRLPEGGHGVNYNFGEFISNFTPPPQDPPPITPPPISPPMSGSAVGPASVTNWQTPIIGESLRPGYGGGALPSGYSWHLSVINAGYPRDTEGVEAARDGLIASREAAQRTMLLSAAEAERSARYVSVNWTPMPMNQSVWYVRDKFGNIVKRYTFGPDGARPLAADFNGDGIAEIAVFHNGNWYIDLNGDGKWDESDLLAELGTGADQPVVGDWDGDGKADIGIFGPQWNNDATLVAEEPGLPSDLNTDFTVRPKNMPPEVSLATAMENVRVMQHSQRGQVRMDVIDHVFQYGGEGDQALTGDFSGDSVTKIGIYRDGKWYIDYNGNGRWDDGDIFVDTGELLADLGLEGKGVAVVGDFNGDGVDKIGLFVDGTWLLDTTGDFRFDSRVEFGQAGDYPVVGDFSGDGISQLALYRASNRDSLYADNAPARSLDSAPEAAHAIAMPQMARQFSADGDATTNQGTLPEDLQERTQHTPHTDAPLQRRAR